MRSQSSAHASQLTAHIRLTDMGESSNNYHLQRYFRFYSILYSLSSTNFFTFYESIKQKRSDSFPVQYYYNRFMIERDVNFLDISENSKAGTCEGASNSLESHFSFFRYPLP